MKHFLGDEPAKRVANPDRRFFTDAKQTQFLQHIRRLLFQGGRLVGRPLGERNIVGHRQDASIGNVGRQPIARPTNRKFFLQFTAFCRGIG